MITGSAPATRLPGGWRSSLGDWVMSAAVQRTVIALIILNAITLGLETSPPVMASIGPQLVMIDRLILAVFVGEIVLKLLAMGGRFFRDGWNVFDLLVVGVALVPSSGPLAVLRTLRVLRVMRLVSTVPRLRFVVEALLKAIPGIGAIGALILIIFYVGAVMATGLFGAVFPEWFGSIGRSMYTLFQVMTLESWSMGIARPVMTEFPYAWAFFVPFILLSTFTMLNLFIAIIVNTMQTLQSNETSATETAALSDGARIAAEVRRLGEEVHALRTALAERGSGERG